MPEIRSELVDGCEKRALAVRRQHLYTKKAAATGSSSVRSYVRYVSSWLTVPTWKRWRYALWYASTTTIASVGNARSAKAHARRELRRRRGSLH